MRKKEMRDFYRKERRNRFTEETWIHICSSSELTSAKTIASYLSYGVEPSTIDINAELIRLGKLLFLPRLLSDRNLEWVAWSGDLTQLQKNGNHFEPLGNPISTEIAANIDAIIVPALQVDREGNRLGQGGGSYDRALCVMQGWKIGLVHVGEITSEPIPHEPHDQKLNAAATPDLLVRFND
jgi:5-formyltetrahydrofolate cyclo-ligase